VTFEILNSAGVTLPSSDALYTRLNLAARSTSALQFQTDIAMTDGTVLSFEYLFKVKATATGGATSTKDVKVTIIVCGSETLTHPTQATYAKTLDIGASATPFDVDLTALFTSSDTYCPVKTYHLKTTDTTLALSTDPSTADALNYYLSGTTMKLFAKKDAVYNFYIYALSASGALVTMPAALTV